MKPTPRVIVDDPKHITNPTNSVPYTDNDFSGIQVGSNGEIRYIHVVFDRRTSSKSLSPLFLKVSTWVMADIHCNGQIR